MDDLIRATEDALGAVLSPLERSLLVAVAELEQNARIARERFTLPTRVELGSTETTDPADTIGGVTECPECEAETEVTECPEHSRCPKCRVCGFCDLCALEA